MDITIGYVLWLTWVRRLPCDVLHDVKDLFVVFV
jgi:hypothetical protein